MKASGKLLTISGCAVFLALLVALPGCSEDQLAGDLQFERERNALLGGRLLSIEVENDRLKSDLASAQSRLRAEASRASTLEGTLRYEKARNAALMQQLQIQRMNEATASSAAEADTVHGETPSPDAG